MASGECSVIVADTPTVLTGKVLFMPGRVVAPMSVGSEVKDSESMRILETAVTSGRLELVEPPPKAFSKARDIAKGLRLLHVLSKTDLEVLALAIDFMEKGCRVAVATDDYALQRAAARVGLSIVKLRYRGITE